MHLPYTLPTLTIPSNFPAQAMQSKNHLYFVMPNAGVDLYKMLHDQSCDTGMEEEAALDLIIPIFDALRYLHGSGFAHRDVKSENILVTDSPRHVYLIGKVPGTPTLLVRALPELTRLSVIAACIQILI